MDGLWRADIKRRRVRVVVFLFVCALLFAGSSVIVCSRWCANIVRSVAHAYNTSHTARRSQRYFTLEIREVVLLAHLLRSLPSFWGGDNRAYYCARSVVVISSVYV